MAQTIKIKRSSSTTAPTSLASGELAYSTKTGVQKLYYGDGTDVLAIGGKSYTDKLDGIEAGATADQTDAQIRAAVEAASDSNVFTDADHTKLDLIGSANGTNAADASVVASANNLGVIRIGDGLSIAANGEVSADEVTSTSVTNAGALMDSEVTNLAQVKAFSSADYATAAQGTLATNALPKAGGTLTGNLSFGDNVKAQFGASNDLQIYHDSNNSIIKDAGSGVLRYTSSSSSAAGVVFEIENTDTDAASGSFIHFKDSSGLDPCKIGAVGSSFFVMSPTNEYMIKANSNSDVELYHDNVKKLETTTDGIAVSGDIALGDNNKVQFGNAVGGDLQIYHNGSASYISEVGTGNLKIMGSNLEMKSTSDEMYLDATQDGVLRLYCDNQIRLTTTGTGVTVSGDLKINNTTLENSLETGHIYAPEVLVIDPASHSANTGKVVIDGDLEVKGVTTTIDSTTVKIADNYIQLNTDQDPTTAPPTTMFCGIQVDRGSEQYDSGIYWVESSDEWVVNTGGAGINRLIHDSNFEAKYPTLDGGTF